MQGAVTHCRWASKPAPPQSSSAKTYPRLTQASVTRKLSQEQDLPAAPIIKQQLLLQPPGGFF